MAQCFELKAEKNVINTETSRAKDHFQESREAASEWLQHTHTLDFVTTAGSAVF